VFAAILALGLRPALAADVVINSPTTVGSTYTVNGRLTVNGGGSLGVTGNLNVSGDIANSGLPAGISASGLLTGGGSVFNDFGRTFVIQGGGYSSIAGTLTNQGAFTFGNGSSASQLSVGALNNAAGANLLFLPSAALFASGPITNAGVVSFQWADFQLAPNVSLANSGTWGLTWGNFINHGTVDNAPGGVISLTSGSFDNWAQLNNDGSMVLSIGNFQNESGATLSNQGFMTLTHGSVFNQGSISQSGQMVLGAGDFTNMAGGTLTNQGTIALNTGSFDNLAGAAMVGDGLLTVAGTATFHPYSVLMGNPTITAAAVNLQGTVVPGSDGTVGQMTFNAPTQFQGLVPFDLLTPGNPGVGSDLIRVAGGQTATIQSGTQFQFHLSPTAGTIGQQYEIIRGNVSLEARPVVTDDNPADDRRIVLRTDQDVYGFTHQGTAYYALVARSTPLAQVAAAGGGRTNQVAMGRYLDQSLPTDDHAFGTDAAHFQWIRDTLDLMPSEANVAQALGQMAGEIYAPLAPVALQRQFFAYNQLAGRLREDIFRPCGLDQLADREAMQDQRQIGPIGDGIPDCWIVRGWATGYGFGGVVSADQNAEGCSYSGGGAQATFGYQVSDQVGFGFFGDFGSFDLKNDLSERADVEAYSFGGYLSWQSDCDYALFIGGGGFSYCHATRSIESAATGSTMASTAQGATQGGQAAFYGEYGRNIQWDNARLRPYLGALYMTVVQKAFDETGAGPLNLHFDDSTVQSFRTLLGAQLDLRYQPMSRFIWSVRGAWMHEYVSDDQAEALSGGLAAIPDSGFALLRPTIGRDWWVAGCGVRGSFCDRRLRPFASYDLAVNSDQTLQAGFVGLEYVW
jgi:uncharacterized protein with beta-barrel porin domain